MKKPTISVAATTGLLAAISDEGADPDPILRAVGLERSALENRDGFIATATFAHMLEEAARATHDDSFGLHFGVRFDPKDIGALLYVVLHSETVGLAMHNIERYVHIHNNAARVSVEIEGDRAHLRYHVVANGTTFSMRQHNEYSMGVLLSTFRMIGGDEWRPLEVQFEHGPLRDTAEHSRVCRCPVLFGMPANAMVVQHDFLGRVLPHADPKLYRVLNQYVERLSSELPREMDWLAAVRNAIAEAMLEGDPKRVRVARKLSISTRTLERRLKEHEIVYSAVVDDTRRQFALTYLKDRKHSLTEIAFLLAYSEVSAFNRAFKRWTGATPARYRERNAR